MGFILRSIFEAITYHWLSEKNKEIIIEWFGLPTCLFVYLNTWQFGFNFLDILTIKGFKTLRSMETTPPERESNMEWIAVSTKRRVGKPVREPTVVSMDSREKDPCWKFVMELGDYRTEPEILAELHLNYPWVKLGRRNGVSGNAHLTAKDERSRALLVGLRTLNGKTCVFLPLESWTRRTYILMGVPRCITANLLLQDEQVHDAERMTCWDPAAKLAVPTDMVKVVLSGKQHPARFQQGLRELQNETIRKGPTAVPQLPEVCPHGQDMLEGNQDMQVLCWRPQVAQPKSVATKTIAAYQRRQTPKVSHPVQRKEESQRCGVALKSQPSNP